MAFLIRHYPQGGFLEGAAINGGLHTDPVN